MHDDAALAAVQSALVSHPDVLEARVAYVAGLSERPVAWVAAGGFVTGPDLRQHVRALAGEHAVPDVVAVLAELPAEDGAAGPEAEPSAEVVLLDSAYRFVLPRSAVEQRLAGLCAVLLGVPDVGVLDDFVEMGGDSLFAISLLTEIQSAYGFEMELAEFYELGSIEQLAAAIERGRR